MIKKFLFLLRLIILNRIPVIGLTISVIIATGYYILSSDNFDAEGNITKEATINKEQKLEKNHDNTVHYGRYMYR